MKTNYIGKKIMNIYQEVVIKILYTYWTKLPLTLYLRRKNFGFNEVITCLYNI